MSFDLNNIIRTAAAAVIGLSITIPVGSEIVASGQARRAAAEPTEAEVVLDGIVNNLTSACVDYRISKVDSKLERNAKNEIDEYFDGEVSYKAICDYVLG